MSEHFFTSHLDRAAVLRRDEGWVNEQLGAPSTLFVPVWRQKSFVDRVEREGDAELRRSGHPDSGPDMLARSFPVGVARPRDAARAGKV